MAPRRGIETITCLLTASVEHGDSMGNRRSIGAGDVRLMTTGSGSIHRDTPKGEVHWTTCEGASAGLRTDLRGFRSVHNGFLATYIAVWETMTNAKAVSAEILKRMCAGDPTLHAEVT